jgi:hypothetical protein
MLKYDKHNSEKENDNDNSKLFRPVRAAGRWFYRPLCCPSKSTHPHPARMRPNKIAS